MLHLDVSVHVLTNLIVQSLDFHFLGLEFLGLSGLDLDKLSVSLLKAVDSLLESLNAVMLGHRPIADQICCHGTIAY